METRAFGRTGYTLPVLGLGCQRLVDSANCPEHEALKILERALAGGICYYDVARVYGLGQAEERLGKLAAVHRAEMWIASKTMERTCSGALRQLEESLTLLHTDYVDEWRLHNIETVAEMRLCFEPGGVMDALRRAKEQGKVRWLSISSHTHPQVLIEALRYSVFDSMLFPASALDHYRYSFETEFLPQANAAGVATIGMKVLAPGRLTRKVQQALRYSLSLPVSMVIAGCTKLDELESNLLTAETFTPMDEAERQTYLQAIQPLVTPKNVPWKTADWGKSGVWLPEETS